MIRISFAVWILLFPFSQPGFASGTSVGNGGDPVFAFMEAARLSMIESLKVVATDPTELDRLCHRDGLSNDQIAFCKQYVTEIEGEILRLNQGNNKTLFVLREEPLYVEGPDGQPMVVAARTELGAKGPIELHRDSVKTMLPTQVLFLLMHEFQHKASYQNRSVSDNEQIGPFAMGRDLLDSVATGLVAVARQKGKVGSQFGIRDIFDCRAYTSGGQFGARLSSSRMFESPDLMSYQTSLGKNPTDGSMFLPENVNSVLQLRFVVNEPNNCGGVDPKRQSVVQIIRSLKLEDGSQSEEVIVTQTGAENPLCPNANPRFEIAYGEIKFTCAYFGSEGTTSSEW